METIKNVSISELHSFRNHPFKVETNTELCELMRSIEKEGVLVPLLVRTNPYGDGYEVISGHRRKEAALWAGETEVPVVIRELDDDQAVVAMVDSNLHRENLKPSEKAFAYRMKLEAMKHQGKKVLADDITLAQVEPRSAKKNPGGLVSGAMRSNELLAKQAGESVAQIKRYIRLTNLIPKILNMVDEGKIAFTVAVELSYLKEEEQYELHAIMDLEQCTPSLSQACRLKVMSQHGTLDMDVICMVLEEEKPNQREQIKLRADALAKYFPEDYTPKQKTDLIEQLLKEWYEKEYIEYDGAYYIIGEGHKGFVADKQEDDDTYILTLAAIAKELEARGLTETRIHLAVGLPLKWVQAQRDSFKQYLTRERYVSLKYRKVNYLIEIVDCTVMPQGYAAVAENLKDFKGMNLLVDIGNGTMNVMYMKVITSWLTHRKKGGNF